MNEDRHNIIARNSDPLVVERFSWSAILAGVFITLAIFISFMTLGLSLGLAVMDFEGGVSITASTWFSAIWTLLSFMTALAVATYCTARLTGRASYLSGLLNGLTVWAVASVLVFYGASKGVNKMISASGQAVTQQVQQMVEPVTNLMGEGQIADLNLNSIKQMYKEVEAPELKSSIQSEFMKLRRDARRFSQQILMNPDSAESSLNQLRVSAQKSIANLRQEYDKDKIAEIISRNSNLSESEVEKAATQWQIKLDDVGEKLNTFFSELQSEVMEVAGEAKNSVAATSFSMFLFLGFGFLVSIFFSSMASKKR